MKVEWTVGVPAELKEERRQQVRSAEPVLEILKGIFQKRLDVAVGTATRGNYGPGWEQAQVDAITQVRIYRDLIALLTLDRE